MIKIFDHWRPKEGWRPVETWDVAVRQTESLLDDVRWIDSDRGNFRFIEISDGSLHLVWAIEVDSWLYCEEEAPLYTLYTRYTVAEWNKLFPEHPLTTKKFRVDYIVV